MPYFVESFEGLSWNGPVDDTVCHILLWTIFRRYRRRAYDIFASHTMKMLVQMKRHIEKIVDGGDMSKFAPTAGRGGKLRTKISACLLVVFGESDFLCGPYFADKRWNSDRIHDICRVHHYPRSRSDRIPQPVNVTDSYVYPSLNPHTHKGLRVDLFLLAFIPILGLLSLLRTMKKLAFVSIFGTLCIVFAIAVVVFNDELYIHKNGVSKEIVDYNFSALPTFFGIAVFSFSIHGVVLSIVGPMERPQDTYPVMNGCSILVE